MKTTLLVFTLGLMVPLIAREPLAARISHADPAKYRHSPSVHGGPGALDYMALLGDTVDNIPGAGIGRKAAAAASCVTRIFAAGIPKCL